MAQKANVEPDMATYWFNSMLYNFYSQIKRGTMIYLPGQIRLVEFDQPQKQLKMAQKTNVEPDMATYWYNSMIYKYFLTN